MFKFKRTPKTESSNPATPNEPPVCDVESKATESQPVESEPKTEIVKDSSSLKDKLSNLFKLGHSDKNAVSSETDKSSREVHEETSEKLANEEPKLDDGLPSGEEKAPPSDGKSLSDQEKSGQKSGKKSFDFKKKFSGLFKSKTQTKESSSSKVENAKPIDTELPGDEKLANNEESKLGDSLPESGKEHTTTNDEKIGQKPSDDLSVSKSGKKSSNFKNKFSGLFKSKAQTKDGPKTCKDSDPTNQPSDENAKPVDAELATDEKSASNEEPKLNDDLPESSPKKEPTETSSSLKDKLSGLLKFGKSDKDSPPSSEDQAPPNDEKNSSDQVKNDQKSEKKSSDLKKKFSGLFKSKTQTKESPSEVQELSKDEPKICQEPSDDTKPSSDTQAIEDEKSAVKDGQELLKVENSDELKNKSSDATTPDQPLESNAEENATEGQPNKTSSSLKDKLSSLLKFGKSDKDSPTPGEKQAPPKDEKSSSDQEMSDQKRGDDLPDSKPDKKSSNFKNKFSGLFKSKDQAKKSSSSDVQELSKDEPTTCKESDLTEQPLSESENTKPSSDRDSQKVASDLPAPSSIKDKLSNLFKIGKSEKVAVPSGNKATDPQENVSDEEKKESEDLPETIAKEADTKGDLEPVNASSSNLKEKLSSILKTKKSIPAEPKEQPESVAETSAKKKFSLPKVFKRPVKASKPTESSQENSQSSDKPINEKSNLLGKLRLSKLIKRKQTAEPVASVGASDDDLPLLKEKTVLTPIAENNESLENIEETGETPGEEKCDKKVEKKLTIAESEKPAKALPPPSERTIWSAIKETFSHRPQRHLDGGDSSMEPTVDETGYESQVDADLEAEEFSTADVTVSQDNSKQLDTSTVNGELGKDNPNIQNESDEENSSASKQDSGKDESLLEDSSKKKKKSDGKVKSRKDARKAKRLKKQQHLANDLTSPEDEGSSDMIVKAAAQKGAKSDRRKRQRKKKQSDQAAKESLKIVAEELDQQAEQPSKRAEVNGDEDIRLIEQIDLAAPKSGPILEEKLLDDKKLIEQEELLDAITQSKELQISGGSAGVQKDPIKSQKRNYFKRLRVNRVLNRSQSNVSSNLMQGFLRFTMPNIDLLSSI